MRSTLTLFKSLLLAAITLLPFVGLHAQIITTVVGGGTSYGDGGLATAATLNNPTCVVADATGSLYIADYNDQTIRKVNGLTHVITTIAGMHGSSGLGADLIAATSSLLDEPNGVAIDAAGNIYIAEQGGSVVREVNTSGIIFTIAGIDSSGTVHEGFDGDGIATAKRLYQPTNVAVDPAGNVYIADWDNNRVRVVTGGYMYTVAGGGTGSGYGGPATAEALHSPYSVSLDGHGSLYVSDENGQRLVRIDLTTDNIYAVGGDNLVGGFSGVGGPATAAEYHYPDGIVADAGSLYISDYGNEIIRQINIATDIDSIAVGTATVAGFSGDGGPATAGKLNGPAGVAIDVYGNIYIADFTNNRIREVASNNHAPQFVNGESQSLTVCENSVGDSLNTLLEVLDVDFGQTETWSLLEAPVHGTAVVSYVTTSTGGDLTPVGLYYTPAYGYSGLDSFRVEVNDGISVDSTTIHVTVDPLYAGAITPEPAYVCPGSNVTLTDDTSGGVWSTSNSGIATVSGGVVTGVSAGVAYISYTITNSCGTTSSMAEVTVGNPIITTIAGGGTGGLGDGGAATAAELAAPTCVITDAAGNIYIADEVNYRVRKVNTSGVITTVAGTGAATWTGGSGGPATNANISPDGICLDPSGNLVIASYSQNYIFKVTPSGIISIFAGTGSAGDSGDGGPATSADLNYPYDVVSDPAGNIYFTDGLNDIVRVVKTTGNIYTVAGTPGSAGFAGDNGIATAAVLNQPSGIAIDNAGNLYVADYFNNRIRKFTPGGFISTVAGNGIGALGLDGVTATSTSLQRPEGVYVDEAGNLFIADFGNSRVQEVNTSGIIYTISGNGFGGFSGDGGPATAANLFEDENCWLDASGNIYIADVGNSRIRKITPTPPTTVSAISGPTTLCSGTIDLTDPTIGGVWSSSNIGVATVGTSGTVAAVSQGTTIITYLVNNSCGPEAATQVVTVTPPPSPITGTTSVCTGLTTQLNDGVSGGTWSSGNTTVGTVGSTGLVYGVAAGSAVITYSLGAGCNATTVVTVNASPGTINPPTGVSMCVGNFFDLSDGSTGGTWSSSNAGVGSVTTSGVVWGVTSGAATISYTLTGGCYATRQITVNVTPAPLSPLSATICQHTTTTFTESVGGGTWSSSNNSVGTVFGGEVGGVGAGSAMITYAIGTCLTTATVTVNAAPTSITGTTAICNGSTSLLTGNPTGGTWASSTSIVATITSGGLVTALSVGSSIITYTLTSGCNLTTTVIVTTEPSAITGNKNVCVGGTTNLSDMPLGGVWSSNDLGVATVSDFGQAAGVGQGTTIISYTLGTCYAIIPFTVNPNPAAISGQNTICVGGTSLLSDGTSSGTWSSSNSSVASVAGGTVSGVVAGTATISYSLSTSCYTLYGFTVNPLPGIISGNTGVCLGATTTLSDGGSGTWSSSNLAVGTINSGGTVTGLLAGSTIITYTLGTSCQATTVVTVFAAPSVITGSFTLCSGGTTTLNDASGGGTWSSGGIGVATINSSSGFVNAVSAGTAIITYTNSATGCYQTATMTVNTGTSAITGSGSVCVGSTLNLHDVVLGGQWTSNSLSVATVGTGSGVVTGVGAGTTIISYSVGLGCYSVTSVTVNALPGAISPSGSIVLCPSNTLSFTDGTAGGTWSSSNTGVATIGSLSGGLTAIGAGSATVTYTDLGCSVAQTLTVSPAPTAIMPVSPTVCVGSNTTLTDGVSGGTWVSNSTGIATVGSGSGTVSGVATGTTLITYSIGTCFTTTALTVSGLLTAGSISGPTVMCVTTPITLTDPEPGGTWVSGNTGVATVGTTGIVSGVGAGTVTISFVVSNMCGTAYATHIVDVSILGAGAIAGPDSVCAGTFGDYTDAVTGGVWSMANLDATVTVGGVVTGISMGSDIITYTVTNTCGSATTTKTMYVGAYLTAGTITGPTSVCAGSHITLSDLAPGGTWSAGNTDAIVSGSTVTGIVAGVDTISYTVTSSCGSAYATYPVTVNPTAIAGSITGPASVCIGSTPMYTDAITGGTWSVASSTASISAGGVLTPVSVGSNIVSYSVVNSCGASVATEVINIGPLLTAGTITGLSSVCVGSSIMLSDATSGGVWSASNGDATVVAGNVTGVSAGVDVISYTVSASCGSVSATASVTVVPIPAAGTITGAMSVCTGTTFNYTDGATGGTWSMANSTASITSGGVLTPISDGTNIVSYSVINSCGAAYATENITIGTGPNAGTISGSSLVCIGTPNTLTETASGGAWSVSNADATVAGGVVNGVSAGADVVSYTVTNTCGTAAATFTVNVNNAATAGTIIGPSSLCTSSFATYIDGTGGGTWALANGTASITGGGMVTPLATGTNIVSYSTTGACGSAVATKTITISTSATAGTISGPTGVCIGSTITLTGAVSGGTWTSAATSIATVSGGVVTGVGTGTTTISYMVTDGCGTAVATYGVASGVAPNAGSISGASSLCAGSSAFYADGAPGGIWGVSNTNASITSIGLLTAVTPYSADTVTYTVTNGCGTAVATRTVSIGGSISAGVISGAAGMCMSGTTTLSETVGGGVWTSSVPLVATIGAGSGVVDGIGPGTSLISYTVTLACGSAVATWPFTVSSSPVAGIITGPASVCAGSEITLTDLIPGGVWSSINSNASVSTGGVVTGLTPGVDTVIYAVSNFCGITSASTTVAISTYVGAGIITGPTVVCPGANITLSDASAGGVWSSANGNATVTGTSGVVTGVSSGSDNISYTVTNACGTTSTFAAITIGTLPDPGTVTGPDTVCAGSDITLADVVPGGVWSAGNTDAIVSAGLVVGVAQGVDPISYTVTNSCGASSAVLNVVVDSIPTPGVISGSNGVCIGSGIVLIDTVAGGTWVASNSHAAVVGVGIIDGVTLGTDTIFYEMTNSCGTGFASKILSVNPLPVVSAIGGPAAECPGSEISMTDAVTGGIWVSNNPAIAYVGATTGIVTGVTTGTVIISYTVTNVYGCPATAITVDTVAAGSTIPGITGTPGVCTGVSTTLADAMTGGTWSSSGTSTATIGAGSGELIGINPGTVTISYTVASVCGSSVVTAVETVYPNPVVSAITGAGNVCEGSSATLADVTSGGVWASTDVAVATVGTLSGMVTGMGAGIATLMYTFTNLYGCSTSVTAMETVVAAPMVAAITGTTNECMGMTTTLSDGTTGGYWVSGDPAIAAVGSGTGIVTGVMGGVAEITYMVANIAGCTGYTAVGDTVNVVPTASAITGGAALCVGASETLGNSIPYGTWSSHLLTVATIDAGTGMLTGVSAGTDKVYYTVNNSCGSVSDSATVTVNATPSAGTIDASYTTLCSGTTVNLAETVSGGVWGSENASVATVSTGGVVAGVAMGTAIITYNVTGTGGCSNEASTVVNIDGAMPAASVSPSGSVTLCNGASKTMTVVTAGTGLTYQWMRNGSPISGANTAAYTTTTAGNYSVEISNGTCSETLAGPSVLAPPTPVVTYSYPNELETGSFTTYQWYLNGSAIPGAESQFYYYTIGGNYSVDVTDANGCTDASLPYSVTTLTFTAVQNVNGKADVKVYPNPATDIVHIDAAVKVNVRVMSIDGKILIDAEDASAVDISGFADGIYIIQVYDQNNLLLQTDKITKIQ